MYTVEGINSDIEISKEENFITLYINDEDVVLNKAQVINLINTLNTMVVD